MPNPPPTSPKVSSKVSLAEPTESSDSQSPTQSEKDLPTIPEPKHSTSAKKQSTETVEKNSWITMKVLLCTLLIPFLGWVWATELSTPFVNSTGKTVNNVPYSTREYWMKQAVEELFKFQGPWYSPPSPPPVPVPQCQIFERDRSRF